YYLLRDVDSVNGSEARVEYAIILQQLNRPSAMLGKARLYLGGLFSYMHIHLHIFEAGIFREYANMVERQRTDAVERDSNFRQSGRRKPLGVGEKHVYSRSNESRLQWIRRLLETGSCIGGSHEYDAQPHILRRP